MHPDWARSLRDQCAAAGTAFLFKQWGAHAPAELTAGDGSGTPWRAWQNGDTPSCIVDDLGKPRDAIDRVWFLRVGKKHAGRMLDGRTHDAFPQTTGAEQ